jgi:hypothetical protein
MGPRQPVTGFGKAESQKGKGKKKKRKRDVATTLIKLHT